jgi:hypothetical protein
MKDIKNIEKTYNIAKTLTPLLHASLIKKKSLKDLFMEVDKTVNEIISESEIYQNLNNNEKLKISKDLFETIAVLMSNEVLHNNNSYMDETKDEIIYLMNKLPNYFRKINIEDEKFNKIIQTGLTYIIKESYSFHNTLYLSDELTLNEMRIFNLNTIKTAVKNIALIMNYLKENTNDEKLTSENFKMSGYIYSIGLASLFEFLMKDPKKINDYINNQEKYLKKIDKTFIDNYGILTKTTKAITNIIKK